MKQYPTSELGREIWKEISLLLAGSHLQCLPQDWALDGEIPLGIETTKRGVVIRMDVWFLTGGNPQLNPQLEMELCLARPRFSTLQSVTVEKVRASNVEHSCLDGKALHVTLI